MSSRCNYLYVREALHTVKKAPPRSKASLFNKSSDPADEVLIRLYHPLDGINNPKYKLLHFLTTNFVFVKRRRH
jgi:hypothetical protein